MAATTMTAESRDPSQPHPSKNHSLSSHFGGSKPPKVLVFDPWKPGEVTEEEVNEHNKESSSFEVQLPRWRNQIHVYEDQAKRRGYVGTLRLDRLGFVKNCKRRLGYDYRVLHVKGENPDAA